PCRRRREHRPYRSRLQPAPHPRLAEHLVVPHPDSAHTSLHDPLSAQISLLTDDYFVSATKIPVQSAGGALAWNACTRVEYKSNSVPSPKLFSADRHSSIASNAPSQSRLR